MTVAQQILAVIITKMAEIDASIAALKAENEALRAELATRATAAELDQILAAVQGMFTPPV